MKSLPATNQKPKEGSKKSQKSKKKANERCAQKPNMPRVSQLAMFAMALAMTSTVSDARIHRTENLRMSKETRFKEIPATLTDAVPMGQVQTISTVPLANQPQMVQSLPATVPNQPIQAIPVPLANQQQMVQATQNAVPVPANQPLITQAVQSAPVTLPGQQLAPLPQPVQQPAAVVPGQQPMMPQQQIQPLAVVPGQQPMIQQPTMQQQQQQIQPAAVVPGQQQMMQQQQIQPAAVVPGQVAQEAPPTQEAPPAQETQSTPNAVAPAPEADLVVEYTAKDKEKACEEYKVVVDGVKREDAKIECHDVHAERCPVMKGDCYQGFGDYFNPARWVHLGCRGAEKVPGVPCPDDEVAPIAPTPSIIAAENEPGPARL